MAGSTSWVLPPPSNSPRTSNSSPVFDFSITKISHAEARKLLGVRSNFTKSKVVLRYRILARKCYLDRWNSSVLYSTDVSAEIFKMISNVLTMIAISNPFKFIFILELDALFSYRREESIVV